MNNRNSNWQSFKQQQQENREGGPRTTVRGGVGTQFGPGVAARPRRTRRPDIVFAGPRTIAPEVAARIRAQMGRGPGGEALPGAANRRARTAARQARTAAAAGTYR